MKIEYKIRNQFSIYTIFKRFSIYTNSLSVLIPRLKIILKDVIKQLTCIVF